MSAYEALNKIIAVEKQIELQKREIKTIADVAGNIISKIDDQISGKQSELKAELDSLNIETINIDSQIAQQKELQTSETEIKTSTQKRLDAIESMIADLRPVAARADQIKVAEASIKALEDQKESVIKEGISLKEKMGHTVKRAQEKRN